MSLVRKGSLLFPLFLLVTFLKFSVPEVAHALTIENIPFVDSTTIGGKPVPLRNSPLLRYLNNIAMAAYVLAQLRHIRSGDNLDRLFSRKVSP
jgi:hypothetical protein